MPDDVHTDFFESPADLVSFAPPPGKNYEAAADGEVPMFGLDSILGFSGHRFEFVEPGGTSHLLPGRPLSKSTVLSVPANAGFFVMIQSFAHAYVRGDNPGVLRERPLGQMSASAGLNMSTRTLTCHVRLTDSNMDDPVRIIVGVGVVFFN